MMACRTWLSCRRWRNATAGLEPRNVVPHTDTSATHTFEPRLLDSSFYAIPAVRFLQVSQTTLELHTQTGDHIIR